MKVSCFTKYSSLAGKAIFDAFIYSLKERGVEVVENDIHADVAVIWSVLWHGRMKPNKDIWFQFRAQNKPVIVLEVGGLIRNTTWKVSINGINRNAEFGNYNSDDSRVKKLGLSLDPWRTNGNHIILCGQHGFSEQWANMKPVDSWMLDVIGEIRKHTNRKIIIRPHPRFTLRPVYEKYYSNVVVSNPKHVDETYDSFNFDEALKNAWAVINYSSNPAMESVLKGVPVFVSQDSLCWDVGNDIHRLDQIENPKMPDRETWLNKISYTEWTEEEIKQGLPWDRIYPYL